MIILRKVKNLINEGGKNGKESGGGVKKVKKRKKNNEKKKLNIVYINEFI